MWKYRRGFLAAMAVSISGCSIFERNNQNEVFIRSVYATNLSDTPHDMTIQIGDDSDTREKSIQLSPSDTPQSSQTVWEFEQNEVFGSITATTDADSTTINLDDEVDADGVDVVIRIEPNNQIGMFVSVV